MHHFIFRTTLLLYLFLGSVSKAQQPTHQNVTLDQNFNLFLSTIINQSKTKIPQGKVADYIPELGKADQNQIGIAVMDHQGNLYTAGDSKAKFTIQSISKVIALMIAVQERGEKYIFERMGYYGTDQPFNSFESLNRSHKPLNPMMNAGAIVTTASIKGDGDTAYQKIVKSIRWITKNDHINLNQKVYLSEKETGNRNRGMFYLAKNFELLTAENEDPLDNYFKQCSIEVDAEDLAKIAYFFAHQCTRFDGDTTYFNPEMSQLINSMMTTAGMYDYSGEFARKVGIPTKSGVGGGLMGVVPRKYGIGTFSPALDEHGNSIAGIELFIQLSNRLQLSIFN